MTSIITPQFVEFVPPTLELGVLYISIPFKTALHSCCCGCGFEVVTPLSPARWTLIFDGDTVSLEPSIGNWSAPCRSHYWIRHNRVIPALGWSDEEIAAVREEDTRDLQSHYSGTAPDGIVQKRSSWFLKRWLKR